VLNLRYILLVVALLFGGHAWSDEPSNHKAIAQKDKNTEKPQTTTKLDTTSLEKTIRESIKEASEKPDPYLNEKRESDGKLVEYTRQLAVYTEKLATETKNLSQFTFFLVIVGALTALVLACQSLLIKEQVKLSRQEFVYANRPILEVRRERIRNPDGQWGINFVIANTGKLIATKIVGNFMIRVLTEEEKNNVEQESLPPYSTEATDIGQMLNIPPRKSGDLDASQRAFIFLVSPEISNDSLDRINTGEKFLCFWGYINFSDPLGKVWETAFFRTYNFESEIFETKDDPDYEHT
jgi:hypothetical protein